MVGRIFIIARTCRVLQREVVGTGQSVQNGYGLGLGPEYYVLVIVTNSHEGEFVTTWH